MQASLQSQRHIGLDVIRGIIIFAILIININYISTPSLLRYSPLAFGEFTLLDSWVWGFEYGLIKQRFMPLLSLMFGAGIYLFAQKYKRLEQSPTQPFVLRTLALIAIGMVHAYLIWDGDVLVSYAVCGLAAFFMRNLPNKVLLTLGAIMVFAPVAPYIYDSWQAIGTTIEDPKSWLPNAEAALKMQTSYDKSWLELTPARIDVAIGRQTSDLLYFTFWRCTGLMLIGIVLMRNGFLLGKSNYRLPIIISLALGLPLSIIPTYYYVQSDFSYQFFNTYLALGFYLGSVILAFTYLFLLIQWTKTTAFMAVQKIFAKLGRMALTLYIMQSVICGFIFYGYGLNLFAKVSRSELVLITIAIWLFQLAFTLLWFKKFNTGPLEALWRACYTRKPKMETSQNAVTTNIS